MCGPKLMDFQRTLLVGAIAVVGVLTLQQWNKDYPGTSMSTNVVQSVSSNGVETDAPTLNASNESVIISGGAEQPSAQLVTVSTDTIKAVIDPAGGDIISVSLPQYPAHLPSVGETSAPFQLLINSPNCHSESTCVFTAQSALVSSDGPKGANNQRTMYTVKQADFVMQDGAEKLVVNLLKNEAGIDITKRFTFYPNRYDISVDYTVVNNSDKPWKDQFYAQLKRDNTADPSQLNSKAPMNTYLGAAVRSNDEPYTKLPFEDSVDAPFKERVEGGYAAILQHYFVTAWVPNQAQAHQYYANQKDGYNFVGFYDDAMVVEPGQTATTGATLYAGPKDQATLNKLSDGLELTVDYGMLWFIAQPLFTILKWVHSIVGNWGWSIILLTVLVKALFYPLNATSFRSMAKMRKLGPQLQALKEKYGDDRQKMSQEMMELYRKEKVNPMGGCLPILVQMPVFIALYWTLLESVELRQAPWLGWIYDLSQMDPYFILPLIMGASMFAQQMLNPTPPDPTQAKVMKMIPVIFTFFFLFFPAGLVLYWVTNNILSIVQQYIITKQIEKEG